MEVGIDFGTTFSTVCYGGARLGDKACLQLSGSAYIPTEIYIFSDNRYCIGHRARSEYRKNGGGLYINPKRWIGANSFNVHTFRERLQPTYAVENDGEHAVKIGALAAGSELLSITTLVALFIKACIREVEDAASAVVTGVVCSVPAKYNSYKRSYLAVALENLGVPLRALINEPTAAALYGMALSSSPNGVYGVFDFGGGTFDIAFIEKEGPILGVVGSDGDNYLGGRDIDKAVSKTVRSRLKGQVSESTLLVVVADIKEQISQKPSVSEFPIITSAGVEQIVYTIDDLNKDSRPFVQRAIDLFEKNLNELGRPRCTVILTGGSSALPLVDTMVRSISVVSQVIFSVDSFRASVALGAKVYSDVLSGTSNIRLIDCLSQTLSDELLLFQPAPVFIKGGCVPSRNTLSYEVTGNTCPYAVFEGEEPAVWLNEMTFKSIDARPSNASKSDSVEYNITIDGRLIVKVDGRTQVNLLNPPKPDENKLRMTYILSSGKYVEAVTQLYCKAFETLYKTKVTVEQVMNNTGPIAENFVEENYEFEKDRLDGAI